MATLFISDLHLDPDRPVITALFLDFLQHRAVGAEALYILGDLFEAWIGDDDDARLGRQVAAALKDLTAGGVPVYLVHGNRDFLVGERFAAASGVYLLSEATVIDLYGTPTLIMHGDTLCTDDLTYQAFRAQVRSPQWQAQLLARPLAERRQIAKQLREGSQQATQQKAGEITDVNPDEVIRIMREYGISRLIHGHTHRPAIHNLLIDGRPAQRIVLGDWYEQGSVLSCNAAGCRLEIIDH
jgi:UDP-2,3-diacylglucosamine hydrolase